MDDIITAVKSGAKQQHQVSDQTVQALKWIILSLTKITKASVSIKKLLAREGDWNRVKEVLGCTVNMESVKVALKERKLQELLTLLYLPDIQLGIVRNDLEYLIGKLIFMHLAVTGGVTHL